MTPVIPNQFGPVRNAGQKPALVLIEEKSSGGPLLQDLARMHVIARGYNPGNADKTLRLHLVSDLIKDGFVYLAESEDENRRGQPKSWYAEFLNQLCTFRGEKSTEHDDYVDSTTQALSLLRDQVWLKPEISKKYKEDDDEVKRTPRRQGNPYAQ
jgi:predicted phage terminase large subunit-like protein